MALTPTYEHGTTMKKVNVNGSIYWLKDADLRELVESFGSVVYKDVVTTLTPTGANIATEKATADYIAEQIKGLEGAMHFRGVVERTGTQTDLEAIAAFYAAKSITPDAGDVVIMKDNGKEYIYDGTAWEEIGDQNIYLTIAEAAATYTPLTRTIAGIDLQDDITVAELEASTALDLKALAHKASASGTVEVADDIDDIAVAKIDTYTVAGESVAVPATYNALDVTPAGTVDVTQTTQAAATYQKVKDITVSAVAPSADATANYTPAGTITLPTYTASVTLSGTDVATVTDAGTAYTLSDGSVVKADDTKAKFVKKGVSFGINADDAEQLDLAYVSNTDETFYTDAVTAAGEITYTKQTISGALPTFGTQNVALTTGITATAVKDGDATFSGTGVVLGATNTFETADATVTQPVFSAGFTGTTKNVTPTVATTVDAQAPDGTITLVSETKAITLNKKTVTVTVE